MGRIRFAEQTLTVECTTLDDWAQLHDVPHIDFMWLDMEGHELQVLQHATSLLPTVHALFTEVNFVEVREGSCLYKDVKAFLRSHGFIEIQQWNFGRFGNALFVKKTSIVQ